MAQSRLHNVATIYTRLQGMIHVGAISEAETPMWFQIYRRFPPRRPPDAERPLVQKSIKKIFYPEDNLRAQFYHTYHNSTTTGDKGLTETKAFSGGACEVFLKGYEVFRELRPHYYEEDLWYLAQRWVQDEMGIKLTHRGDRMKVAEMRAAERLVTKIEELDREALKAFLIKIEEEELETIEAKSEELD